MWGGFEWFPCIILLGVSNCWVLVFTPFFASMCCTDYVWKIVGILVVSTNYGIGNHEVFGLLLVSNDDIIN